MFMGFELIIRETLSETYALYSCFYVIVIIIKENNNMRIVIKAIILSLLTGCVVQLFVDLTKVFTN